MTRRPFPRALSIELDQATLALNFLFVDPQTGEDKGRRTLPTGWKAERALLVIGQYRVECPPDFQRRVLELSKQRDELATGGRHEMV